MFEGFFMTYLTDKLANLTNQDQVECAFTIINMARVGFSVSKCQQAISKQLQMPAKSARFQIDYS